MKKWIWLGVIGLAALALSMIDLSGWLQDASPESSTPGIYARFVCDDGKSIAAVFRNGAPLPPSTPGGPPVPTGTAEITPSVGKKRVLKETISASGARYANDDESFVFWNKGDTVLVLEDGREKTFTSCKAEGR